MAYLGTQPNDVKKNTGLYTPSEILQLTKDGSWGGSLELIEEQTVSSATSSINFTNIKGSQYDVHFLTILGYETNGGGSELVLVRFSNDGGSTYESSNYQNAQQVCATSGSFSVISGTSDSAIQLSYTNNTEQSNNYVFLYNLNNSSKYSFATFHGLKQGADISFGSGVYAVSETINALQVTTGVACDVATIKLYGVKQI
jgi:hypothetical protein